MGLLDPNKGLRLKKSEILSGRELFKRVALKGKRFETPLLRCSFLINDEGNAPLQIAFKVPAKTFNAVRRNRLKRLMREGFSAERAMLDAALRRTGKKVALFLTFKHSEDIPVEQLKLTNMQPHVASVCAMIAAKLEMRT